MIRPSGTVYWLGVMIEGENQEYNKKAREVADLIEENEAAHENELRLAVPKVVTG